MAAVAERLGLPFMPWQRLVADVGGEIDPATGHPAYREVIVTVPRQSGKTTLVLAWEIQRALGWGSPQRIAYSAQTGNDARKKLIEDQAPILKPRQKKLGIARILQGMGNEAVEFVNGSRIVLMASSPDSGHGKTIDLGVKDELFADFDNRRDQAMVPAMATRAAAQVLTASTMGTDESVPLNAAVERGRAAVDGGLRAGVAYFEYSAAEDADPDDPATWWGCMPALGHTITEPVVADARRQFSGPSGDSEFWRAFLNVRTKADSRVLPLADWVAVCSDIASPSGPLVFGVDVNPDRSAAAIVVGSGGDVPTGELVEYRPGTAWVVGRCGELAGQWSGSRFVLDGSGPAASLLSDLGRVGVDVHAASARELIAACGQLFDGVMQHRVRVRRHPKLDDAAAGANRRKVGDAWAWTRKSAQADVSPLVALTLALWLAGSPPVSQEILVALR